jgi:glycosyltransferase involved in cell wall biosynthesis
MKIGYLMQLGADIQNPPFNGPANHTRHVVAELQKMGHHVHVLYQLDGVIWHSTGLASFKPIKVNWTKAGPFRVVERGIRRAQTALKLPYAGLFESIRFAAACCQVLGDCGLYYERTSWMGYGGSLASRWSGIPLILEDNGDHLLDLDAKNAAPQGLQRWMALKLMHFAVHQASHVISSGDGWRLQFIRRWGVPAHRVSTVENGTLLIDLLERQQLRSFSENLGDDPVRFVYLGGFYAWHGVPVILKAFQRALAHGLEAELLLIGAGEEMQAAQEQVNELQLNERVFFKGQLTPEVFAPILASADIGLAPYCNWPEYSGLKIFDYKAAGLPVIVSGMGGMPRTIKHDETGWIIPPCDEEALLNAILTLGYDAARRKRLGQAARLEAEERHTWCHTAEKLEATFKNVLGEREQYA